MGEPGGFKEKHHVRPRTPIRLLRLRRWIRRIWRVGVRLRLPIQLGILRPVCRECRHVCVCLWLRLPQLVLWQWIWCQLWAWIWLWLPIWQHLRRFRLRLWLPIWQHLWICLCWSWIWLWLWLPIICLWICLCWSWLWLWLRLPIICLCWPWLLWLLLDAPKTRDLRRKSQDEGRREDGLMVVVHRIVY